MGVDATLVQRAWWDQLKEVMRCWVAAIARNGLSWGAMDPEVLERMTAAGKTAWPDVNVSTQAFEAFLHGKPLESEEHAGDLFLACGCAHGEPHAVAAFDAQFLSRTPGYIARIDRDPSFADEVLQQLRHRLLVAVPGTLPRISEYAGRGPLGGWVRVVAIRAALEMKRSGRRDGELDDDSSSPALASPDPELQYVRVRYAGEFKKAFTDALQQLESRQRTILKLYLVDGLNIDRIGTLYEVHRATVARWINTARDSLYDGTRSRLQAELNVTPAEFESLLGVVRSDLDVSVCRLLRDDPAAPDPE